MKRRDIFLIAVLLAAAAAAFGIIQGVDAKNSRSPDENWLVIVKVANETTAELPLSEDTEYEIAGVGGTNRLRIADGRVWIEEADCENQVCVRTGKIDRTMSAASISCLPHRVIVYLTPRE